MDFFSEKIDFHAFLVNLRHRFSPICLKDFFIFSVNLSQPVYSRKHIIWLLVRANIPNIK